MLVIGMYKGSCKRKGLARRGNATTIYNRWPDAGLGLGDGRRSSIRHAGPFSTYRQAESIARAVG